MTPQELLAQWRATTDLATQGPWVVRKTRSGNTVLEAGEDGYDDIIEPEPADCLSYCYGGTSRWTINPADADFMSTSRAAMPALLAFAEAVLEGRHNPLVDALMPASVKDWIDGLADEHLGGGGAR